MFLECTRDIIVKFWRKTIKSRPYSSLLKYKQNYVDKAFYIHPSQSLLIY